MTWECEWLFRRAIEAEVRSWLDSEDLALPESFIIDCVDNLIGCQAMMALRMEIEEVANDTVSVYVDAEADEEEEE